jgi:hypothetical protein
MRMYKHEREFCLNILDDVCCSGGDPAGGRDRMAPWGEDRVLLRRQEHRAQIQGRHHFAQHATRHLLRRPTDCREYKITQF